MVQTMPCQKCDRYRFASVGTGVLKYSDWRGRFAPGCVDVKICFEREAGDGLETCAAYDAYSDGVLGGELACR